MSITLNKQPNTISAIGNKIVVQTTITGAYCELQISYEQVYRGGTYEVLSDPVRAYPNGDSKCVWDIHRLLEGIVGSDAPTQVTAGELVLCTEMSKRYSFVVKEYDSDDEEIDDVTVTGKFAVNARAPIVDGQRFQLDVLLKNWLTLQASTKYVSDYQPEFLYFCINGGLAVSHCNLSVFVTYTDDTTETLTPLTQLDVEGWDIVRVSTGYRQLGLHNLAKTVKKWVCTMKYNTVQISQPQTYEIAPDCSPLDRFFIWRNPLGGYDALRTTGEASAQYMTEGQTYNIIPSPLESSSKRRTFQSNTIGGHNIEQHTGFLSPSEKLWLRGMENSEDVYRVGGEMTPNFELTSTKLVPITIKRGNFELLQDNNFTDGLRFEYEDNYY